MFGIDLSSLGSVVKDIREAITGEAIKDPTKLAEIKWKLQKLEVDLMSQQNEINKIEANSTNLFIAGWRPAIGWIGAISLAYIYIIEPTLQAIFNLKFPTIDNSLLINIVIAMLGIGSLRTFEKIKGVNGNHK